MACYAVCVLLVIEGRMVTFSSYTGIIPFAWSLMKRFFIVKSILLGAIEYAGIILFSVCLSFRLSVNNVCKRKKSKVCVGCQYNFAQLTVVHNM